MGRTTQAGAIGRQRIWEIAQYFREAPAARQIKPSHLIQRDLATVFPAIPSTPTAVSRSQLSIHSITSWPGLDKKRSAI